MHRTRWLLISLGLTLLLATIGVFALAQVRDRLRVDTAVSAIARGEPGCVTTAAFTGPDGVERVVDVRRYKGNCLRKDPGDAVTVYYDRDDPAVTTASRSWWWSALTSVVVLGLAGLTSRAAWKTVRES